MEQRDGILTAQGAERPFVRVECNGTWRMSGSKQSTLERDKSPGMFGFS